MESVGKAAVNLPVAVNAPVNVAVELEFAAFSGSNPMALVSQGALPLANPL